MSEKISTIKRPSRSWKQTKPQTVGTDNKKNTDYMKIKDSSGSGLPSDNTFDHALDETDLGL